MELSDFDYHLPDSFIASHPIKDRVSAKLFAIEKNNGQKRHLIFKDIIELFCSGDVLVLNNTKVIPARLFGNRKTHGKVEVFLLKQKKDNEWEALLRPSGRVRAGEVLDFKHEDCSLSVCVVDAPRPDSGNRLIRFDDPSWMEKIETIGHVPLPPYIRRKDSKEDREDYQTVFAVHPGAIASPTAGLHFNHELLEALKRKVLKLFM